MTELDPVAADVPAGFVAVATHEYALPAYVVGQVYVWLLYAPSGPIPASHKPDENVTYRVAPPFDEVQVALTLVSPCPPPLEPPTMFILSNCDCEVDSDTVTDAGATGTPHAVNAALAEDAEDVPTMFVEVAVQV